MGYCEDTCEYLTSRHNCKKYHKGLTYCGIDIGSVAASYHERCSECEKDHWIMEQEKELEEYRKAERQGTLLHLPCKVGDTVYVLAECGVINTVLDGTYETATGYYCPYELNGKCPHDTDDCEKCRDRTAVFEDIVEMICFEGDEIQIMTEYCEVLGPIGGYIFMTREEAEAKLKENGGVNE